MKRINGIPVTLEAEKHARELVEIAAEQFKLSVRKVICESQLFLASCKPGEKRTFKTKGFSVEIEADIEETPDEASSQSGRASGE